MRTLAYGTWPSPLRAADLARGAIQLGYLQISRGAPYWVESRPLEGGRYVIATLADNGELSELTPPGFNVRTRVHEYGGTPFALGRESIYFSNFSDQRLYAQRGIEAPVALTPDGYRYADFALDSPGRCLFCVREDHTAGGEPRNTVVVLDTTAPTAADDPGSGGTVLFSASDFVAYPRVSRDGRRLAWIAWNHPDMPWDAAQLHVADLDRDRITHATVIAGGPHEAVLEPQWNEDGSLYFISDRSGWWNLYRYRDARIEPVLSMPAEMAGPLWTLGQANFALLGADRAALRYGVRALDRLGLVNLRTRALTSFDLPFVALSSIQAASADSVVAIAASATEEAAIVKIDLSKGTHSVLRAPGKVKLDPALVSVAVPLEFPTDGGRTASVLLPAAQSRLRPPRE